MKTVYASVLMVIVLPGLGIAQRGGGGIGFRGAGVAYPPPGQSASHPWLASRSLRNIGPNGLGARGLPVIWWSPPFDDNCCQYDNPPRSLQPQTLLTAPELSPPIPPEPPARPVMHEYSWPRQNAPSVKAFFIVSKDGQVRRAVAIWVLNDELHYAGVPGSPCGTVPLDAVDMERTRRLNAEEGLTWPIADP